LNLDPTDDNPAVSDLSSQLRHSWHIAKNRVTFVDAEVKGWHQPTSSEKLKRWIIHAKDQQVKNDRKHTISMFASQGPFYPQRRKWKAATGRMAGGTSISLKTLWCCSLKLEALGHYKSHIGRGNWLFYSDAVDRFPLSESSRKRSGARMSNLDQKTSFASHDLRMIVAMAIM